MNYIDTFHPDGDGMYKKGVFRTQEQLVEQLTIAEQALQAIESALQRDRNNAMAYVARSYGKRLEAVQAVFSVGRLRQEAVADCNRAQQMDTHLGEAYFAKAVALVELKQLQDARATISRFIEIEPYDEFGYVLKYKILQHLGRNEEAAMTLLEAKIKLN